MIRDLILRVGLPKTHFELGIIRLSNVSSRRIPNPKPETLNRGYDAELGLTSVA